MKTKRLLRVLAVLAFLLLIAPFYDSCNGQRMKKAEVNAEAAADTTAVIIDSTEIDSTEIASAEIDTTNDSGENYEISFARKAYDFVDDDDSENAFEFAKINIDCISELNLKAIKEIREDVKKKDGYKGIIFHFKNFCFLLIVIVTFLILIFSFKNDRLTHKFSKLNLILILITVICLFTEGLFETISQIKWGYYAFITVNLLIFYYSRKSSVKQT